MPRLRTHAIILQGPRLTLRPMHEGDWPLLLRWKSDPEILYFTEGNFSEDGDVPAYDLTEIQAIYRTISQDADCFIAELRGRPIGECWLQAMNLRRILHAFPDQDCRRIDLMIGEKDYWGQGYGTEIIRLLTTYGFEQKGADLIFGCDIADYNPASLAAFKRVGYRIHAALPQPQGDIAQVRYDLVISGPSADECLGSDM